MRTRLVCGSFQIVKNHFLSFTVLTFTCAQFAGSPALFGQAAPTLVPATPVPAIPSKGTPKIQFSETTFNFGKVQTTDKPQHEFIFTNTGDAMLEITDVRPGCGCTTAGAWDRQVQPGKTGKVPLQFNPANFSGPVTKMATVACNDPTQPSLHLQFQANVWRPIEVQPQYVYFLPVEDELTNDTKVVRIVSNIEEPITLGNPFSTSAAFKTELKTVREGKEFELHVTYAGPVSNANSQATITFHTSSTNMPNLSVNVVVMPQPALVAMPQQIQLPPGPLSQDYHYPATIRNNGHTPLKLSDPSVNAEGVTVQMQEMDPGKTFNLNLSFTTNFQARAGQPLELTVKTSHPRHPIMKVPITQLAARVAPGAGFGQPGGLPVRTFPGTAQPAPAVK